MSTKFESRDYQEALIVKAKEGNTIVCLPTGAGKTYIALCLIQSMAHSVPMEDIPFNRRKWILFTAVTVPLVQQQATWLAENCKLKTSCYIGDMQVDLWDEAKWKKELQENQLLVMTPEIVRMLIDHNYLVLTSLVLLVIDECHHAVKGHPLRQVMDAYKLYQKISPQSVPKILGLSATLLNSNVHPMKIPSELAAMEDILCSKAYSFDSARVERYATDPEVLIRKYHVSVNSCDGNEIKDLVEEYINIFKSYEGHVTSKEETIKIDGNIYAKKTNKPLKEFFSILEEIKLFLTDLGLLCTSYAVLYYSVHAEQMILKSKTEIEILLWRKLQTGLFAVRCVIDDHIRYSESHLISPKLKEMLSILREYEPDDVLRKRNSASADALCGIVFVERRTYAMILHYFMQHLGKQEDEFAFLKTGFVVGCSMNPNIYLRENLFFEHRRQEIMKQFRQHELNLIFATSVLEEGIDVPKCNLVLRFDIPKTFTAYIQSKGRARKRDAMYYVLTCDADGGEIEGKLKDYDCMNTILQESLSTNRRGLYINVDDNEDDEDFIEPYKPFPEREFPKVTAASSISLLNRYCQTLPHESCIVLQPLYYYTYDKDNLLCKAVVKLPGNAPVRHVQGKYMSSETLAKRFVSLEAIKKLHQLKELSDDRLMPVGAGFEDDDLSQGDEKESDSGVGTKKKKRLHKKQSPGSLNNIWPDDKNPLYMYHIQMVRTDHGSSKHFAVSPEHSQNCLGLVTTKRLPKICRFPLYPKLMGEVEVSLHLVKKGFLLSKNELKKLIGFHHSVFTAELHLKVPEHPLFFMNPKYPTASGGLVVPLIKNTYPVHGFTIDYSLISAVEAYHHKLKRPFPTFDEEFAFNPNVYEGAVVVPVYKENPSKVYTVVNICHELTPLCKISNTKSTYRGHFSEKYDMEITNDSQPLLQVKCLGESDRLNVNFLTPRHAKNAAARTKTDHLIHLIPELCHVHPIPISLFIQIMCLPCALYRIHSLINMEELRRTIAKETGIGKAIIPEDEEWIPLQCNIGKEKRKLQGLPVAMQSQDTVDCCVVQNHNGISSDDALLSDDSEKMGNKCDKQLKNPQDICDVTLDDLVKFHQYISAKELPEDIGCNTSFLFPDIPRLSKQELAELFDYDQMTVPENEIGVQLSTLTQALTLSGSNDGFDLERLETIGDSFLKYAVSVHVFCSYPCKDEGKLSAYRTNLIKNKYLYKLAIEKGLPTFIVGHMFEAKHSWIPPGYAIPMHLEETLKRNGFDYSLMRGIKGEDITKRNFTPKGMDDLVHALNTTIEENNFPPLSKVPLESSIFFHQYMADKSVADSVESLIGAYLLAAGPHGALKFMSWLGIRDREHRDMTDYPPPDIMSSKNETESSLRDQLCSVKPFEKLIDYKFKNPLLMVQAFMHPTYHNNSNIGCYQNLEYLGDAILDYLITRHLFHDPRNHNSGELTDLRSALVNNITFGSLAVRYQFHKYLLHSSSQLQDLIEKFIKYQQQNDHKVTGHFTLLCDDDSTIASEIEVPKALGDIFESVAGAIFLDSGMSLQAVWRVYYPLMKKEIETFSSDVPLSPVREIYERYQKQAQFIVARDDELQQHGKILVQLLIEGHGSYFGTGINKKSAKLAASKCALKKINY